MSPDQVADVEGVIVTVGLLAALLAAASSFVPALRARLIAALGGSGTFLAAGIAGLATAGSLWFSEGAGFPPCEFCWYQRIAMYPLVVVLGIAALRRSATTRLTGMVLAGAGIVVSGWHNVIETFPSGHGGSCDPANPCTIRWVEGLGFWTIPRMALACFVLILACCLTDALAERQGSAP